MIHSFNAKTVTLSDSSFFQGWDLLEVGVGEPEVTREGKSCCFGAFPICQIHLMKSYLLH